MDKKKIKPLRVLGIIIFSILIILCLFFLGIYTNVIGNMESVRNIEYDVVTDELMEKYYGKKYVKNLEKNIEEEKEEIKNEVFKPKSSGIEPVENALAMYGEDFDEEVVQVVSNENIPIAKSEEQWYLDLINIYYNQPITEEEKYRIAEKLDVFYRGELSEKNGYEDLKTKIEPILKENGLL